MVCFALEDRKEFGYGHISRSSAIINYYNKIGVKCLVFFSNNKSKTKLDYLQIMFRKIKVTDGDIFEVKEIQNHLIELNGQPKLFFIDGNRFTNRFIDELNKKFCKTVLIDDNADKLRNKANVIWNPNIFGRNSLYKNWNSKNLLTGKHYLLFRQEFFKEKSKEKSNKIFVSLGGTVNLEQINLMKSKINRIGYEVVLADNFTPNEMVDNIDSSLVTICGASVTLHEVWIRKSYAIPVYLAKDQRNVVDFLINNNIKYLDLLNNDIEFVSEEICEILLSIIEKEKLQKQNFINQNQIRTKKILYELYFKEK